MGMDEWISSASNWGRNSPYEPFVRDGLQMYYGDFTARAALISSRFMVTRAASMPWRGLETLSQSLPWLRQKFPPHHAFANATSPKCSATE